MHETAASSEATARADAFARWAKKRGVFVSPHVAMFVPTTRMGYGVFARTTIPAGTTLLSCPAHVSLSPYNNSNNNNSSTLAVAVPAAAAVLDACAATQRDRVLYVTLLLMAERCRRTSPWREWLEACPDNAHHLFLLTHAQAAALAVQPLANNDDDDDDDDDDDSKRPMACRDVTALLLSCTGVSTQLREVAAAARWRVARRVMRAHATLWPPPPPPPAAATSSSSSSSSSSSTAYVTATPQHFAHCLAHVLSRNFHREEVTTREGPYLLPGLDFLNHAGERNTNVQLHVRGGGRRHGRTFDVVTTRPLRRGEQVCLSYGRIGAARYAVEFAFVTRGVARDDLVRFDAHTLIILVALAVASWSSSSSSSSSSSLQHHHDGLCHNNNNDNDDDAWRQLRVPDEACVREGMRRVAVLQRCGVLYDEGLLLARPLPRTRHADVDDNVNNNNHSHNNGNKNDKDTTTQTTASAADVEVTSEVQTHVWALQTAVYALAVRRATFDADVYTALSRNWQPPPQLPCSDTAAAASSSSPLLLRDVVARTLTLKRHAVALQRARIDDAFACRNNSDDDSAATTCAAQRALLHAALQSEDDTLRAYEALLQQQQEQA